MSPIEYAALYGHGKAVLCCSIAVRTRGMSVDVIVVSYNTRDLLRACLQSVARAANEIENLHTFVVDNASSDASAEMVRTEFPSVQLIALDKNIGFGPANNRGMRAGNSEYLLFLNSDAELTPGALKLLVSFLGGNPNAVIAGPRLEYPDGRFQLSCRRFPTFLRSLWNTAGIQRRLPNQFTSLQSWLAESDHVQGAKIDMVSGACFLARRDYFESIGGFDEKLFLYEEEMDVMLPARRKGKDVCYCAEARVIHHHGASSGEHQASDASLYHLYRSKYFTFRKHYGFAYAFLTFLADFLVFQSSALLNGLRGSTSSAARNASFCLQGYRASSSPRTSK
ncbi:MAG: glycosyltransferase family 2 protein [Candidatus Hydrogenedentes bacterium]|nr:glycosyltransferase family 2 protein [Candidatus Hydrogenedentota bacterium]